jgi:hypothetical protein
LGRKKAKVFSIGVSRRQQLFETDHAGGGAGAARLRPWPIERVETGMGRADGGVPQAWWPS